MRYAKTFAVAFTIALATALSVDTAAPVATTESSVNAATTSAIVYPDGKIVTVKRRGYPDVI